MTRTHKVEAKLTPPERRVAEEASRLDGLSLSSFVRLALIERARNRLGEERVRALLGEGS